MKRKPWEIFLAALLAVGIHWLFPAPVFPQESGAQITEKAADADRGAAGTGESPKEKALLHKKAGDEFRAREDVGGAAEEYGKALSLYRGFSKEDRLMMAKYLSWSGRNDEAVRELRAILAEDPENTEARIHLARCLGWKGDLGASLEESSKVLAVMPDNRDALLVRANALRWSGNPNAAIRIYKGILEKDEDFDTRIGLSYAFLSTGYLRGAREGESRLTPKYPYQEKERDGLKAEIDKATRPAIGLGYSYYHDSDENRLNRYTMSGGIWTGSWRWGLGYGHVDAEDPHRHARDDELAVSADSKVAEWSSIGGTVGVNQTANGDSREFFVWSARGAADIRDGRIGVGAARRVFAETAELIEKQIRYTEVASFFEYPLPRRFAFRASYSYKDYSDENHSNDIQGTLRYVFDGKYPVVSLAYQVRYLDFQRETGSGYFDPSGFLSHLGFLGLSVEKAWFYAYLEPMFGHQSFRQEGSDHSDWVWGGNWVIGGKSAKGASLEIYGGGGDYAAGSPTGFDYYVVGVRFTKRF